MLLSLLKMKKKSKNQMCMLFLRHEHVQYQIDTSMCSIKYRDSRFNIARELCNNLDSHIELVWVVQWYENLDSETSLDCVVERKICIRKLVWIR